MLLGDVSLDFIALERWLIIPTFQDSNEALDAVYNLWLVILRTALGSHPRPPLHVLVILSCILAEDVSGRRFLCLE